jgi:hypothetical protein
MPNPSQHQFQKKKDNKTKRKHHSSISPCYSQATLGSLRGPRQKKVDAILGAATALPLREEGLQGPTQRDPPRGSQHGFRQLSTLYDFYPDMVYQKKSDILKMNQN